MEFQAAKDKMPMMSVIIPLYNHESYIGEAIDSVLSQTIDDFELIVIDDGSTDNSGQIVRSYSDNRIRYEYHENKGAAYTINKGIRLARSHYISILNSDDVYLPERLEKARTILNSQFSPDAVFTDFQCIDGDGKLLDIDRSSTSNWYYLDEEHNTKLPPRYELLAGNKYHTSSNLICRRDVFEEIGYFKNLRYVHDYEFFLRLMYFKKIQVIDEPLLRYRFHTHNTLDEDYSSSTYETAIILANFLVEYVLPDLSTEENSYEVIQSMFAKMNFYGSERLVLFLMMLAHTESLIDISYTQKMRQLREAMKLGIMSNRESMLRQRDINWQKEQTHRWWKEAQRNKEESEWNKKNCTKWWKTAQEYKNESEWRKEQCDYWWSKAQEYYSEIEKQISSHDNKNKYINKLKKEVSDYFQSQNKLEKTILYYKTKFSECFQEKQELEDTVTFYVHRDQRILYRITSRFYNLLSLMKHKMQKYKKSKEDIL